MKNQFKQFMKQYHKKNCQLRRDQYGCIRSPHTFTLGSYNLLSDPPLWDKRNLLTLWNLFPKFTIELRTLQRRDGISSTFRKWECSLFCYNN